MTKQENLLINLENVAAEVSQQLGSDERLAALAVPPVAKPERRAAVLALSVAVLRAGLLRPTGEQLTLYALDAEQVSVLRDVVGQVFRRGVGAPPHLAPCQPLHLPECVALGVAEESSVDVHSSCIIRAKFV